MMIRMIVSIRHLLAIEFALVCEDSSPRSGVRIDIPLALDHTLARRARVAAPGLHEEHERDQQPDHPHNEEDGADGGKRDAGHRGGDRELDNRAHSNEKDRSACN